MLDDKESLPYFKTKLNCLYDNFIKLSLSDQNEALQIVEGCFKTMQRYCENSKINNISNISNDDDKHIIVDNKSFPFESYTKESPLKYDLVKQSNTLNENELDLEQPIQQEFSDSEKEESNEFSDSSCLMIPKHLNSLVERLENEETFSNADNNIQFSSGIVNEEMIHCNSDDKREEFKKNKLNITEVINSDNVENDSDCTESDVTDKSSNDKKEESSTKFSCALCRKQLSTYTMLIQHIFTHSGTPQSCIKCKSSFTNAVSYKYHSYNYFCSQKDKIYDKNKRGIIKKIMCCPYCAMRFRNTFNLRRHIQNKCGQYEKEYMIGVSKDLRFDEIYRCDVCDIRFILKELYEEHKMKHEKYRCKICSLNFICRRLLREHSVNHHSRRRLYCGACSIEFPNRAVYRCHMKKFKDDEEHTKMIKNDNSNLVWCKVCVMSFINEKTYQKHCRSNSHLQNTDPDKLKLKEFVCEKCGLGFKNKDTLTSHHNRMHKNKELLKCDKCPYSTMLKSNMNRHQGIHHEKTTKKNACDKCPMFFDSSSTLKAHLNCVHSEERPFTCEICNRKFKLRTTLNKHNVVHNPVHLYRCSYCSSSFRRSTNLRRHIRCLHKDMERKSDLSNTINKHKKITEQKIINPNVNQDVNNLPSDQMVSLIDVQSGELLVLSITEINKNNMNITDNGELMNTVHVPEIWPTQAAELFPMYSNCEPTAYMVQADRVPEAQYVTNYIQIPDHKGIENIQLLTDEYNGMKTDMLTQVTLDNEMITSNEAYGLNLELSQNYVNK